MSQYKTDPTLGSPTVGVTNGSNVVTGIGTEFLSEVEVGDGFWADVDPVHQVYYTVTSVDSNTSLQISANWGGVTNANASFAIWRDFTTNLDLPEMNRGDLNTPLTFTRAMRLIDQSLLASPLAATGDTTFLNSNQANTIDVSTLSTLVLAVGAGWSGTYTHTLEGTPRPQQTLFIENNSGFQQHFSNGAGSPLDLSSITVDDQFTMMFARIPSTGKLRIIARLPRG